ncbi:hypothetical protein DQ353_00305 [Arthrobacter sp. AQ5-05]|uniref:hypothetical protein n=1 Tax=Arthrobacter sp. AQ5-05 TaxID=2184581 RepID=UPI000DCC90C1|nr:hypothetical protein [Arthrobacter sp. AQ5-05]RAX50879.1 hypothetical protein DQ353_00305 [Arthrobacter sp. AQ5-05]
MSDQTPSLDRIRGRYCDGTYLQTGHVTDGNEFDRAIAEVRATARRDALNEAADAWAEHDALEEFIAQDVQCDVTAAQAMSNWLQTRAATQ